MKVAAWLIILSGCIFARTLELPEWAAPNAASMDRFQFASAPPTQGHVNWRVVGIPRKYFAEVLSPLFERTLVIEAFAGESSRLEWIFTGPVGGFTVEVTPTRLRVFQRYYDSFGLYKAPPVTEGQTRHPEGLYEESATDFHGTLRAITVRIDYRLHLVVLLNGKQALRQNCLLDVDRHQLSFSGDTGGARGWLLTPPAQRARVTVNSAATRQRMLGFGGIAIPTAYHQLSPEGKRQWWKILVEYNLLIQREYPVGARLNEEMTNWDRLSDAVPHAYGDNFPNGEISDFHYNRTVRRLGGKVIFEFWQLPDWARRDWRDRDGKLHSGVADPEPYARAMVRYCQVARDKAGAPPDIVGIQNELAQPDEIWREMTLALRKALDREGFRNVKIHMQNSGALAKGIASARAFAGSEPVWKAIDYAASNMYDYQKFFFDPDGFDALLRQFKDIIGGKPFLSTELSVNHSEFQTHSYRVAFAMGQLYHKNLTLVDASAILYCWTLLNVVQPSYGWTRALMVPDREHGSVPRASSHQLRVFGAYSRRIKEGMMRVETSSSNDSLLAVAFVGRSGARTIVLLNRSLVPQQTIVAWPGKPFRYLEMVDAHEENSVRPAPEGHADGSVELTIEPGAIITLSNVELGRLAINPLAN